MSTDTLALLGGTPVRGPEKKWPSWPVFDETERAALLEVLDSGKWWYGERVAKFERDFAAFQDARHGVTCSSGTAAVEICMQALDIKPGDEVIVPPYTFVATASAVLRMGGVPIFVDVDESWCLNPDRIEAEITPRTRAIMPVHFGGRVADMDRIDDIAEKHGLAVIEDACHSWGAKWENKGTGTLGLAGVFSFQVSKNITAGEGGIVVSNDETFAEKCRAISNCGRLRGSQWYGHSLLGTNARMTEFAAAILSAQLTRLEAQTLLREENASYLNAKLGDIEGLEPQSGGNRTTRRAYHLYCLRLDAAAFGCSREKFVDAANAEGLPVGAGYGMPLYRQPVFTDNNWGYDYRRCHCPVTEDLCYNSGMWIPHQILLGTKAEMADIVAIVQKIKANAGQLT